MSRLDHQLRARARRIAPSTPVIFDLAKEAQRRKLASLFATRAVAHVIDDYKEQQAELYAVKNPARIFLPGFAAEFEAHWKQLNPVAHGRWVYFPWSSTLVHILAETEFQLVRTARNRDLITSAEQKKFYEATIGICGLSVGNSVALAIALQGGGRRIKLADHDSLALTNTNRVRAGVQNLGLRKVEVTARQIYETNPYANVELFPEGITSANIKKFFKGLDIVIDELDNLAVKYLIREEARRHRIAVVMAADNGDNGVVDIERYDLHPKLKFFHGRMGKVSYEQLLGLDKMGIGRMITKHIGAENVTAGVQRSMPQIGKTIVSWPQLGGAALLNGSAVAYCVRKILNGEPLEKNRALISLDEKLVPSYATSGAKRKRAKAAVSFKKIFGL
jgi:hypothetical protein